MTNRFACLTGCLALLLSAPASAEEFPANMLFVASHDGDDVLLLDPASKSPAKVRGEVASPLLDAPADLAFGPDGLLYVLSSGSGEVQAFAPEGGDPVVRFGAGSGLLSPVGIAVTPDGEICLGDSDLGEVRIYSRNGALLRTVDVDGTPAAVAFGPDGHLFVVASNRGFIQEFDPSGMPVRSFGQGSALQEAGGMVAPGDGRLLVSSVTTNSILVFDGEGNVVDELGAGSDLDEPAGLTIGPDGNYYVANRGDGKIVVLDPSGAQVKSFGKNLEDPVAVAFAPFRFSFAAKGAVAGDDGLTKGVKQPGVLSFQPGSSTVMLSFDTSGQDAVSAGIGQDTVVIPGIEAREDAGDKTRRLHGTWVPDDGAAQGFASLAITIKGKPDKRGFFQVKSADGQFFQGGAGGVFIGSARTNKRLK